MYAHDEDGLEVPLLYLGQVRLKQLLELGFGRYLLEDVWIKCRLRQGEVDVELYGGKVEGVLDLRCRLCVDRSCVDLQLSVFIYVTNISLLTLFLKGELFGSSISHTGRGSNQEWVASPAVLEAIDRAKK